MLRTLRLPGFFDAGDLIPGYPFVSGGTTSEEEEGGGGRMERNKVAAGRGDARESGDGDAGGICSRERPATVPSA